MWDMFLNSLKLFFKGKLFRDPAMVVRQWAIGFVPALIAVVVLVKIGLPVWLVVLGVGLIFGALQPWLFKDLKYN
ncbi:hypothetical protein [Sinimarinibacterium flocculans]|uniref:Uncharacterized protein n=1 Tax=Sinimarinibacterium flocculans TaxID=985250 RepID=A0A318E8W6_9GAMM|nr:hypothetical protein [Sinimarinibacterium flocculans]PXV65686.1 hypothetical protein C8D93_10965 [Sinimarinibacterium flocculans]